MVFSSFSHSFIAKQPFKMPGRFNAGVVREPTHSHGQSLSTGAVTDTVSGRKRIRSTNAVLGQGTLASCMSMAMCIFNRWRREISSELQGRVLVCHRGTDVASQYIPLMNSIFTAQRRSVVVDACMVGGIDSIFLQQAAHFTNGTYASPDIENAMEWYQYLLLTFLPDVLSRKVLAEQPEKSVDLRATCFDSHKPDDIVYVCSMCLSIFERIYSICPTCNTKSRASETSRLKKLQKKASIKSDSS